MSETAEKSDPDLWARVKAEITAGGKGGRPGQWSARKAQMAVRAYQAQGGGYLGARDSHNHLHEWTEEDWGTKSGAEGLESGERYLPKAAREALTDAEYKRTSAAKRRDLAKGKQHSAQPEDVAAKTRPFRDHRTKAELMAEARERDVSGRSKMTKAELLAALA
jgi:hypothetical protein